MSHRIPLAAARQAGFDQIPVEIQQADLLGNAKRLYGVLCSMQRLRREPTYVDLAVELHASTRSIVRWVARLVAAGLIAIKRRGQGRTNVVTVLALVTSGGDKPPQAETPAWQRPARAGTYPPKRKPEERRYTPTASKYLSGPLRRLIHH